ncbi:MAG TPA: LamG-like jellyroll fold domain-containing protein [Phycisphaerae bacterium]|nr:LamG-like jellyroll fold domain-containing protein [Phycisphaerae bacterium]
MAASVTGTAYVELTADNTKVLANMPDVAAGFMATLVIDQANSINYEGGAAALIDALAADLTDLRVSANDDSATYAWGLHSFSQTGGSRKLIISFRVPSGDPLLAASDATYRLWYGGTGGTSQSKTSTALTTDGVQVYWPMNESSGTVADWTTNGVDGTVSGATSSAARIGNGQLFDATDEMITAASQTLADATFTLWVYPTSTTGLRTIFRSSDSAGFRGIYINGGVLTIYTSAGFGSTVAIPTNEWSLIALRLDDAGDLFTISCQNVSAGYLSNTQAFGATAPFLVRIGDTQFANQEFVGLMDELGLLTYAASDNEIKTRYNMEIDNGAFWTVGDMVGGGGLLPVRNFNVGYNAGYNRRFN